MQSTQEHAFTCPYCGDGISMVLEAFADELRQSYIEDCEICCRPIEISYSSADFEITNFHAGTSDG